ncbi:glycosyltransferase family 61 protein [Escherichia coli]|uniref:glycosyltransferase family 61 protein n=1 Tax=Escherichia coli TaxID=562 RepID=UPI00098C8F91
MSYPQTTDSKIYISRRKSSRGPLNEFEVENELKELGFDILYAEDLDFAQQVSIFSNASILIGPHGAGLTNILFMPKNSTLIEIFNSEYIQPDFYLRSRHNNMKYACAIQFNNTFNIEEIKEIIERCQE